MKKNNFQSVLNLLLMLALSLMLTIPCLADTIHISLDGKLLSAPVSPILENGITFVPLRLISENLGAAVTYDNPTKKITISSFNVSMELELNNPDAKVNGKLIKLNTAPKSVNGVTMVPLRFISENLNCSVSWDAANATVNIISLLPVASITVKDYGTMYLELYPNLAPNTVNNFIFLANHGFYNDLTFHRIIDEFMVQGGDPEGTGMGGPGYTIPGEFISNGFTTNTLSHTKGTISMARTMMPDSAGSQFFITSADATYLDGNYAAFGKVIDGLTLLDQLSKVATNTSDAPLNKIIIESIRIDTKGVSYPSPYAYMD